MRNQIDKIIITAMDRFVWFVLLVVMSHLVTEFTRVTGYARGSRNDVVLVNDSLIQPKSVQSLVLYPGQEYELYERPNYYYNNNNNNNNMPANAPVVVAPNSNNNNADQGTFFSFRPLIDSIFEIPISTLRVVNNLVARLTGSYQQGPTQKSAGGSMATRGFQSSGVESASKAAVKKSLMREESA